MTDTLDTLVKRLEAATGPRWELDGEIAKALGWPISLTPPPFTGSLTSALSLVPEGCAWNVGFSQGGYSGWVCQVHPLREHMASGANAAISLCIAALKARASAPADLPRDVPVMQQGKTTAEFGDDA